MSNSEENFLVKKRHFNIRVYGSVQGVFFRASARTHADALDISGLARNESDGSVYIEAEGEESNLKQFVEWCGRGPERAVVTKVEVQEAPLKNFPSFEVSRGIH
jgi:acylphosphatase